MEVYVIVGLKVNRIRSVYYKKCKDLDELAKSVLEAFTKSNADVISIRRVRA